MVPGRQAEAPPDALGGRPLSPDDERGGALDHGGEAQEQEEAGSDDRGRLQRRGRQRRLGRGQGERGGGLSAGPGGFEGSDEYRDRLKGGP